MKSNSKNTDAGSVEAESGAVLEADNSLFWFIVRLVGYTFMAMAACSACLDASSGPPIVADGNVSMWNIGLRRCLSAGLSLGGALMTSSFFVLCALRMHVPKKLLAVGFFIATCTIGFHLWLLVSSSRIGHDEYRYRGLVLRVEVINTSTDDWPYKWEHHLLSRTSSGILRSNWRVIAHSSCDAKYKEIEDLGIGEELEEGYGQVQLIRDRYLVVCSWKQVILLYDTVTKRQVSTLLQDRSPAMGKASR